MWVYILIQYSKRHPLHDVGGIHSNNGQLDLPAAVLPVTTVRPDVDALPSTFSLKKLNGVARGVYSQYDAAKMEGLPVGIQIVHGKRLEEERVLWACDRVEDALGRKSKAALGGGRGWEGGISVELPEDPETDDWGMAGSEMLQQ